MTPQGTVELARTHLAVSPLAAAAVARADQYQLVDRVRCVFDERHSRYALSRRFLAMRALMVAAMSLAFGFPEATRGEDDGPPSREASIRALSMLEKTVMATVEKISPAAVRVVWDEVYGNASGIIVDPDGIVATSGRRHLVSGSPVMVYLSDGREVEGEALGSSWELGIALVRLDGEGPWPSVVLGASSDVKLGAGCIALGHPAINMGSGGLVYDRQPLLRFGHLTNVAAAPRWMSSSCRIGLFDAGGGLFDLEGRLIGIHIAHKPVNGPAVHAGIEGLRRYWRQLLDNSLPDSDFDGHIENPMTPGDALISDTEQNAVDAALAKVKNASVGLQWGPTDRDGCSGTIVTEDGYIATCEHHQRPCGEAVKIHLLDGRIVDGKVLTSDRDLDIGLMKITDEGPWPHVSLGESGRMKPDEVCLALGYPVLPPRGGPRWQEPRIGIARILNASLAPARIASSFGILGGDSGGGLFDSNGNLIAIRLGEVSGGDNFAWSAGIELVKKHWEFLDEETPHEVLAGHGDTSELFAHAIDELPSIVVDVFSGDQVIAQGTIIGSDGWVLTKASELKGEIACRLADGQVLPARLRATLRAHDLALLKIEAKHLAVCAWTRREEVPKGTLITAIGGMTTPTIGIVSQASHAVARENGWLAIGEVRNGKEGVEVVDNSSAQRYGDPILKGDIIVSLDGHPTPDLKSYLLLTEGPEMGVSFAFAGDLVRAGLRRGEQSMEVLMAVRPGVDLPDQSLRRSGFESVFDTDIPIKKEQCGGPVIDRFGEVVGILIARKEDERAYVIPAAVARRIADGLMKGNEPWSE